MTRAYDASYDALCRPGAVDDFFQRYPTTGSDGLAAEMSRLAYCDYATVLAPALARASFSLIGQPFERGGTEAFLAQNGTDAMLVFRGSDDLQAWITNLDARLDDWQGTGRVHVGFRDALHKVWPEVVDRLGDWFGPLTVTGHSQGGALAHLAASLLPESRLVTFGSPRVGDQDFAGTLHQGRRYVDDRDLVCRLPHPRLPWMDAYRHGGRLHFIDRAGRISEPEDPDDAERLELSQAALLESLSHLRDGRLPRHLTDHAPINYVAALAGA